MKLIEARSHPDKNPYIRAIDSLEKYKDDSNVFMTFSDIGKLGLNPINSYGTPTGIYSYPVKDKFPQLKITGKLEFATDRPNIIVFENLSKDILTDRATEGDLEFCYRILLEDNPKLEKVDKEILFSNWRSYPINSVIRTFLKKNKKKSQLVCRNIQDKIWNLTHNAAIFNAYFKKKTGDTTWIPNEWSRLLMLCGYDGVYDPGNKVIHPDEPCQAVFFSIKHLKLLEILKNDVDRKRTESEILMSKVMNSIDFDGTIEIDRKKNYPFSYPFNVSIAEYVINFIGVYFTKISIEETYKNIIFLDCVFDSQKYPINLKNCILGDCHFMNENMISFSKCRFTGKEKLELKNPISMNNCSFGIDIKMTVDTMERITRCEFIEGLYIGFRDSVDLFFIQNFIKKNKINGKIYLSDGTKEIDFSKGTENYKILMDLKLLNDIVEMYDMEKYQKIRDNRLEKILNEISV